MSLAILPVEAFRAVTETPGKVVSGLAKVGEASKGILKDVGWGFGGRTGFSIAKFDKVLHDRSILSCGFRPIDNFLKSSLSDQIKPR